MAKFSLNSKMNIIGLTIKQGEIITVDVPHENWINTQIVRDALAAQTNVTMNCGYNANERIIKTLIPVRTNGKLRKGRKWRERNLQSIRRRAFFIPSTIGSGCFR